MEQTLSSKEKEVESTQPKKIPLYKDGKFVKDINYLEAILLLGSDKDVVLQLLKNKGKINI